MLIKEISQQNFNDTFRSKYDSKSFKSSFDFHFKTNASNKSYVSIFHSKRNIGFAILRYANKNLKFINNLQSKYKTYCPKNDFVYISVIQKLTDSKGLVKKFSDSVLKSRSVKYVLSEVSSSNIISLNSHLKAGFKILDEKNNKYLLIKFKNKTINRDFIVLAATHLCLKGLK